MAPLFVFRDSKGVVIEVGDKRIHISDAQGRLLLKKLAEMYGYRLSPTKPDVTAKYDPVGKTIRINIYEGKTVKPVVIPANVLFAYLKILRPGRHSKKEIARQVMELLKKDKLVSHKVEEYFIDGVFDWKRFFGGRQEYYELFRAPLLLLDKLGIVKESRSPYIYVNEKIEEYRENMDKLIRELSKLST